MRRYYQNRIILGAMLSFLILLAITDTGICFSSYHQMESDTGEFIDAMLEAGDQESSGFRQSAPPPMFGYTPGQRMFPSGFYAITLDENDAIQHIEQHGTTEDAEISVQQMVLHAAKTGVPYGKIGAYKYGYRKMEDGTSKLILLDISIQLQSLYSLLKSALLVSVLLLMLLFIILIPVSGKVADAFVRNSEKQKQFITDAGHELKTPVAIIRANLDVMELTQGKSKWSENIGSQVKRLEGLIPQLVMLSRLNEEGEPQKLQELCFSKIINEEWQNYLPSMDTRKITPQNHVDDHLTISGNEDSIRQLLHLLLDNAVQYTSEGGAITISAFKDSRVVHLTVQNTVDAFPDQKPEELTERFVRGTTARTQKTGGSGIGLAAVKRIMEINKGKMKITYEQPNRFVISMAFQSEQR